MSAGEGDASQHWSVDIKFYIPDAYSRIMPSHSPIADIDFCLFN